MKAHQRECVRVGGQKRAGVEEISHSLRANESHESGKRLNQTRELTRDQTLLERMRVDFIRLHGNLKGRELTRIQTL